MSKVERRTGELLGFAARRAFAEGADAESIAALIRTGFGDALRGWTVEPMTGAQVVCFGWAGDIEPEAPRETLEERLRVDGFEWLYNRGVRALYWRPARARAVAKAAESDLIEWKADPPPEEVAEPERATPIPDPSEWTPATPPHEYKVAIAYDPATEPPTFVRWSTGPDGTVYREVLTAGEVGQAPKPEHPGAGFRGFPCAMPPRAEWKAAPEVSATDEADALLTAAGVPEGASTLDRLRLLIERSQQNGEDARDLLKIAEQAAALLNTNVSGIVPCIRDLREPRWINTPIGTLLMRNTETLATIAKHGQREILLYEDGVFLGAVRIQGEWSEETVRAVAMRVHALLTDRDLRTEIPF